MTLARQRPASPVIRTCSQPSSYPHPLSCNAVDVDGSERQLSSSEKVFVQARADARLSAKFLCASRAPKQRPRRARLKKASTCVDLEVRSNTRCRARPSPSSPSTIDRRNRLMALRRPRPCDTARRRGPEREKPMRSTTPRARLESQPLSCYDRFRALLHTQHWHQIPIFHLDLPHRLLAAGNFSRARMLLCQTLSDVL